jgi:hypothetical protein
MKLRNFKQLKSSILGLVLITVGLYIVITSTDYNLYMISGLLVSGVLLLFVPDKFINSLEKVVFGREIKLFNSKDQEQG